MSHTKGKWSWNMAEDGVVTLYGGTEKPANWKFSREQLIALAKETIANAEVV